MASQTTVYPTANLVKTQMNLALAVEHKSVWDHLDGPVPLRHLPRKSVMVSTTTAMVKLMTRLKSMVNTAR
jgi:hypothetical protein